MNGDSSGDELQQNETLLPKQSYQQKHLMHIRQMSERARILKQQSRSAQQLNDFKLHFGGANRDQPCTARAQKSASQSNLCGNRE